MSGFRAVPVFVLLVLLASAGATAQGGQGGAVYAMTNSEDGNEIDVETWASRLDVELEDVFVLEELDEIASHPGPEDVHEQREGDQEVEGLLNWPPHLGEPPSTRGGR